MQHHGRQSGMDAAPSSSDRSRSRRAAAPREASIVKRLRAAAEKRGFFSLKNHGGPFTEAGLPDLFFIRGGRIWAAEVKRPGEKPTPVQLAFMAHLERFGVPCATLTSEEGLDALFAR